MRMMEYVCPQCGYKSKFEEEVELIISIHGHPMSFIKSMYPPRICEKCGEIMGRVAD